MHQFVQNKWNKQKIRYLLEERDPRDRRLNRAAMLWAEIINLQMSGENGFIILALEKYISPASPCLFWP